MEDVVDYKGPYKIIPSLPGCGEARITGTKSKPAKIPVLRHKENSALLTD